MPRRAVFHRYPFVGRFAAAARRRAYLWSFKSAHVRPALYAGSVLSLLPVMGVQLPLALLLSLLLRSNFMILGGLQFITNPFTAAPIYYATHQLGAAIIHSTGIGRSPDEHAISAPISDGAVEAPPRDELSADSASVRHPSPHPHPWRHRIGTAFNALVLGGTLSGLALGLVLDLAWRLGAASHARHKIHRPPRSRSTRSNAPPQ
ncbi:DUF2062 domain-containing protein [Horticoccus luteus]|uniref:DUF2062 domain-containing protein n=1 Tax=Horticoccus luteus TaxID=2862869 RepID=A0A8F9TRV5_9BACT|nr:DUF2062 domain-containing protein [Horticoccus luteus]QYM78059.1 DUF2062 domain-containing protein [Horticoccus luteus]